MKGSKEKFDLKAIKQNRLANLNAKLSQAKLDVIFCTSLRSLAYVGNIFQNLAWYVNTAVVLPASGEPFVVVPLSDRERVEKETWLPQVITWNPAFIGIPERKFEDILFDFIRDHKLEKGNLGIEGNLSWPLHMLLRETFPQANLVKVDSLMEECMVIKDDYEISLMRKVALICTAGFEAARANVKAGMREDELAGYMEIAMRREGCTGYWVPNQVGTGERVLLDHYPSDAVIQSNHYVKVGVHGSYKLYCGDICNVLALKKAEADYVRLAKVVEEAMRKTIEAMRPGVKASQLFSILSGYISQKGYPKACNWYAGHGLGTGHQRPFISPEDQTELKERMIIIFNPVAQPIDGSNGYTNEVMFLVTPEGAEQISKNPIGLTQL